jgi:hypothetical protein
VVYSWSTGNTERWERGFATLSKFRRREGHCCPSRWHAEGNFELGQWVSVQRYRKDLLPIERKRRLDAIGFIWDWRDYLWEQNFAALLEFKRREGHCRVKIVYKKNDLKLGWWVATQRRSRKEMSAERRGRLDKIGFVWHAPRPYRPTKAPRRIGAPNPPQPRALPLAQFSGSEPELDLDQTLRIAGADNCF